MRYVPTLTVEDAPWIRQDMEFDFYFTQMKIEIIHAPIAVFLFHTFYA